MPPPPPPPPISKLLRGPRVLAVTQQRRSVVCFWNTWKVYDDDTPAFCSLAATPEFRSVDSSIKPLERFVILMYDRTSGLECVNQVRKQLFAQKGRVIEGLPPTKAALIQHTKWAAYQAGHCWAKWWLQCQSFHLRVSGDGKERNQVAGKFVGQLFQKLPRLAENIYDVDAWKVAEVTAHV